MEETKKKEEELRKSKTAEELDFDNFFNVNFEKDETMEEDVSLNITKEDIKNNQKTYIEYIMNCLT